MRKFVFVYSAGVGRTGCFIVIDSMLERMKTEATIDIYGHVTCLRAQRNYMVQTEEQYIFIHEALLESALCGSTEVTARNLHAHLATISQLPPGENLTKLQLEFKVCARNIWLTTKFIFIKNNYLLEYFVQ